jgi:protein arginine kinase activator
MGDDKRKCDRCGKREATVHLTNFVDGKPVQRHLCEECYNNQNGASSILESDIFTRILSVLTPELEEASRKKCPDCGISYLEFRQSFKLGCPRDYEIFSDALDELLEDIHGSSRHVGKVPEGRAQDWVVQPRLKVLQRELQKAVASENFEEAAELRDRIRKLEKQGVGRVEE